MQGFILKISVRSLKFVRFPVLALQSGHVEQPNYRLGGELYRLYSRKILGIDRGFQRTSVHFVSCWEPLD
jgi:hypothetical protein